MDKQMICPKCSGRMEDGFVVDYTYGAALQSRWTEGEPERSFWTGLKLKGKEKHKISTFRCMKCGYLESYAAQD